MEAKPRPIKYYTVPRREVEELLRDNPLPKDFLREYEASRPDVLNDTTQDIFAPNSRSRIQRWQPDYSLFRRVTEPRRADIIVCQNWLELLRHQRKDAGMRMLMHFLNHNFQDKPIVVSWNHDQDSATVPVFKSLPERFFILDYNTSRPHSGSILLPFWNVETRCHYPSAYKKYVAGFVGYVGSIPVRRALEKAVRRRVGYHFSRDRIPPQQWLDTMASYQYALCPRGGGLSSYRFYEAIQVGSVPVLFSDAAVRPYPELDYSMFSLRIEERYAGSFDTIDGVLRSADLEKLSSELKAVRQKFSLQGAQLKVYDTLREYLG